MEIKKIMVAGAGVLGAQVSWQMAFHGYEVCVYDVFEKGLEAGKSLHQKFASLFKTSRGATQQEVEQALARLTYTIDMAKAVQDADLLSESIPENLDIKKKFYSELAQLAPAKTIFTTNSSTLLPSMMAAETGRPEKFLALHFANPVWEANVGEVMMHAGTDSKYFDLVIGFAKTIGLVPIPIYKEQSGYVLNSMLVPLLTIAQDLYFDGVSDFESIDKTWMISTGAKFGPFGVIDLVGMQTVYNIAIMNGTRLNNKKMLDRAKRIKTEFIDKGKLGISTGEGYYKYPNPKYQDPAFLK
jgi:3-hydroxyacyl-CoA dehydrogenase